MPETSEKPLPRLVALDGADLLAAGQAMALVALQAEMQALARLMPGGPAVADAGDVAGDVAGEARHRAAEAEIEAGFDNMPV